MAHKSIARATNPIGELLTKIKLARTMRGFSQFDMAAKLDITQQTYSGWERGRNAISVETLLRLPAILDCSIADILPSTVVTAVDQRRSLDPKLEEIIITWTQLPDDARLHLLDEARLLLDREQLRNLAQQIRRPGGDGSKAAGGTQ